LVGDAEVGAGADVAAAALVGGARVGAGAGVDVDVAAEHAKLAITNTPTIVAADAIETGILPAAEMTRCRNCNMLPDRQIPDRTMAVRSQDACDAYESRTFAAH
jgi:hypothetical protein